MKRRGTLKLFYCYAHQDSNLRDELDIHLSGLQRSGLITTWYDRKILSGASWEKEIETHLNTAQVILLLVSPDFLVSNYWYGKEMAYAIKRHQRREARVIPILLRPTHWAATPFSRLQVLPSDARPVTSWPDRDAAFEDIVQGIHLVVNELYSQSKDDRSSTWDFDDQTKSQNFATSSIVPLNEVVVAIDDLQKAQLSKALLSAFPTRRSLEMMVSYGLNENLLAIAGDNDLESTIFELLQWAEVQGRQEELIRVALEQNRHNPQLISVAKQLGFIIGQNATHSLEIENTLRTLREHPSSRLSALDRERLFGRGDREPQNQRQAENALPDLWPWLTDDNSTVEDEDENEVEYHVANSSSATPNFYSLFYRKVGNILSFFKLYRGALAAYDHASKLKTDDPHLYVDKGNALRNLKHFEEALAAYEEAIRLDPTLATAYQNRGKTYQQMAQNSYDELNKRAQQSHKKARELGID